MKPLRLVLWIVLALAQLAVPAWMIVGEERVLRDGRQLKLQTRPVDPADFFRGRYVALGFAVEEVPRELVRGQFDPDEACYLELREGAGGFAEVVSLHKEAASPPRPRRPPWFPAKCTAERHSISTCPV